MPSSLNSGGDEGEQHQNSPIEVGGPNLDASNQGDIEELKSKLVGKRGEGWVSIVAEFILRRQRADPESGITGATIATIAEGLGLEMPVSKGTFSSYLCNIAKQSESPIASGGRGTGDGYFISPYVELQIQEAINSDDEPAPPERAKEKWLYPELLAWMIGQDYRSDDTSAIRSRKLGKWGNPDITGVRIRCGFGMREVEIATIEAKVDLKNWQEDFFQAVSHRRFANRVYFAFAAPAEVAEKVPADLRYYSEKFGVGVLVIDIETQLLQRIATGTLQQADKDSLTNGDGSRVREIYSAPYQDVPLEYQIQFFEALSIVDEVALCQWGRIQQ